MEQKSNAFLETQPIGGLMVKYAVPCVISLPVVIGAVPNEASPRKEQIHALLSLLTPKDGSASSLSSYK